jgi:hypothetical protein
MQYKLPPHYLITAGKAVTFESRFAPQALNYLTRSPINDAICLRFLQFAIQGTVREHQDLWQTQSGYPFYKKTPVYTGRDRQRFAGFDVRPMILHDGSIGLCVDITSKTISRYPLPKLLSREHFHQWKGQHCIYRYGNDWYEIQVDSLGEPYSEHLLVFDGGRTVISLQKFIAQNAQEPLPPELAQLSPDTSVVVYYNNRGEERAAPTTLCYPIYGTDDAQTGQQHDGTILPPHLRHRQIVETVKTYLSDLHMGSTPIHVADRPVIVPTASKCFQAPDVRFGNGKVLSVRGTAGAENTTLQNLGRRRLELLKDKNAGFFVSRPLDQQYLILPISVYRSWGKTFINNLRAQMAQQYPNDAYDPQVLYYDDSGKNTFVQQGRKIRKFIRGRKWTPGFAVIMVHHTDDKKIRDEDQLGAMALRELRDSGIHGTVIHSETGRAGYEYREGSNTYDWPSDANKRGRLAGYVRNVVLNKILLTNSRWPFMLETPLHADMIIGLDIKGHSTSLIMVSKRGQSIRRSPVYQSKQREKLIEGQARKYFLEVLREELGSIGSGQVIRHIVVHRDGRTYESELADFQATINELKASGDLPPDATLTILDLPKSTMVPVRLFEVTRHQDGRIWVENPQVGEHYIVSEKDAFLCSTGRAFERNGRQKGTTQPLHVRYVDGEMAFEQCLEDIFALTTLTWSRPEDCSRVPVTIRLNDRYLREEATEFDYESLEFNYERQEQLQE